MVFLAVRVCFTMQSCWMNGRIIRRNFESWHLKDDSGLKLVEIGFVTSGKIFEIVYEKWTDCQLSDNNSSYDPLGQAR